LSEIGIDKTALPALSSVPKTVVFERSAQAQRKSVKSPNAYHKIKTFGAASEPKSYSTPVTVFPLPLTLKDA
jgi:hypothetical protein